MDIGIWDLVTLLSMAVAPLLIVAVIYWIGYQASKAKQVDRPVSEAGQAD